MPPDSFQPSGKQIWNHVAWAIEALEAGEDAIQIIAHKHDHLAFKFLGVDTIDDVLVWMLVFLREIKEIGPQECFISHGWADRCSEKGYTDLFLYPYVLKSKHFETPVYLKFAIRKSPSGKGPHLYCHLDIHESNDA